MQTPVNSELTVDLVKSLAGTQPPCVTIVLPAGGNARARLLDVARKIEEQIAMFAPEHARAAMTEIKAALPSVDRAEWNGTSVILSAPGLHHKFQTSADLAEVVEVGDRFNLKPLLSLLAQKSDFYILALSQNHPRLLHCTESTSGEVALPAAVPPNYLAFRETRQPDHNLDGRSVSTGSGKGITFGTSSDRDNKDEYHHDYYLAIDRGVSSLLHGTGIPLVVVAVEHELALYRSINTYSDFVEPGVHGAPDGLKGGEMHRRALELLSTHLPPAVRKDLDNFDKLVGTGHASVHAHEIVRAAFEGRVSHLFLQESAEYKGVYDPARDHLRHHEDGITPLRNLVNDAIGETLKQSGAATVLRADQMPHGVPWCAILRYPTVVPQHVEREHSSAQPTR